MSIQKFHYFFEKYFENIENNKFHGGSPLGNLALELSDINKNIREELVKSYKKIELRFSFFITTLKYAFPEKYDKIVPETIARILIALLEGTILMLKTEKESSAINDFFVIFDSIFIINDADENKEAKKEKKEKSQNQNPYVQNNEESTDNISQNILENISQKSNNADQEIGKIENSNIEENNYFNDDIYYDVDSDSLINVFNNLESSKKLKIIMKIITNKNLKKI